jgi:tRNA threonylcarbamoyladenosine biosynthesis protein TsaB
VKVLAVDTATRSCSVGIFDGDRTLARSDMGSGQTHSVHLMEMIQTVLTRAGLGPADIGLYAVTRGPGSFTGLRIGVSTVKGLAEANGIPIVGVSTLEALAAQVGPAPVPIRPLIDARKGEVYFAVYRVEDGHLQLERNPRAAPPESAVGDVDSPCLFVGDGAALYRTRIQDRLGDLARFGSPEHDIISAETVGRLALARAVRDDFDDVAGIVPFYIRKSDAQLHLGQTSAKGAGRRIRPELGR